LPEVANVLFLFAASVALFALMAFKLFGAKNQLTKVGGKPYFHNYLESAWDLYVLVTTANHPDIMMPAYEVSRWFALFFVAFLVVNLYIFINVFLAVVYNRFRSNLKLEVVENKSRNEMLMNSTFGLTAGSHVDYITMVIYGLRHPLK
jgi:two pore calcium channel protein 3